MRGVVVGASIMALVAGSSLTIAEAQNGPKAPKAAAAKAASPAA
jgi:hypothetical protein